MGAQGYDVRLNQLVTLWWKRPHFIGVAPNGLWCARRGICHTAEGKKAVPDRILRWDLVGGVGHSGRDEMDHLNELPKRDKNHSLATEAETAFQNFFAASKSFFIQSGDRKDYGTDYQIEVVQDGMATNVRLHVQLKGTAKALNADGSISVEVERSNLNYLLMQPYSFYVCYHQLAESFKIRSAESVARQCEHGRTDWTKQKTITINFTDSMTLPALERLTGLARLNASAQRDDRFAQLSVPSEDVPELLRSASSNLHVPDERSKALEVLKHLFERGMDGHISDSFERFAAVLGPDHDAMVSCHMAEINLAMAGRSRHLDRVDAAIAYLATHVDKGIYEPGTLHYSIGNGMAALNRHDEAVAAYGMAMLHLTQLNEDFLTAQCLKNFGSSIEKLGREEDAAEYYRAALAIAPRLAEAHFSLGSYHHRKGAYSEALTHFDQVVFAEHHVGGVSSVAGWRINVLFNLGDGNAAFRDINALLGSAETEKWIWPWCGRQVATFGRTSLDNARQAVTFWARFLRAHPDNSVGVRESLLAKLYVRSNGGDIGMSRASFKIEFEAGIAHVDGDAVAHLWDRLGHWAQDEEDWVEAEFCFRRAYDLEGGHYGYCLGTALNFLGRFEESLPILRVQAEELQSDAMSWFQVAAAHEHLEHVPEAIKAYEQAIALDPDYDVAWFNLGGVHWNNGDRARGVEVWNNAIKRFPNHELTSVLRRDMPTLFF